MDTDQGTTAAPGDEVEALDYGAEATDEGQNQEPAQASGADQQADAAMEDQQPSTVEEQQPADNANGAEGQQPDNGAASAPAGQDDVMAQPPHGTEIFMSKIPREASEAQVKAFCNKAGEVYAIRLPKDPAVPTQNKGFAFCVYKTKEAADEALTALSQQELPDFPGRKVMVVRSDVKNRLFIGNIPREMSQATVQTTLEGQVKGLLSLELMTEKESGTSRGFGFAEFYNNAAAEAARRIMSNPDFKLGGRELTVTWAEPRRSEAALETVKAIYISNLPEKDVDDQALRDLFSAYGSISNVVVLKQADDPTKLRGYAFVHFAERAHALKVMTEVEGGKEFELGGNKLSIQLAKPQTPHNTHEDSYGRGGYGGGRGYVGGYSAGGRGYGGRGGRGAASGGGRGRAGYSGGASYGGYDSGYDAYGYGGGYDAGYGGYSGYEDDGYGGYGGYGSYMMPMMMHAGYGVTGYGAPASGASGGPARRTGGAPPHPSTTRQSAGSAAGRSGSPGYTSGRGSGGSGYSAGRGGGRGGAGGGSSGYVPRGYGQGAGGRGPARYAPY